MVTLEEDGTFWVHDVDTDNIYVGWGVECVMKHMYAGGDGFLKRGRVKIRVGR